MPFSSVQPSCNRPATRANSAPRFGYAVRAEGPEARTIGEFLQGIRDQRNTTPRYMMIDSFSHCENGKCTGYTVGAYQDGDHFSHPVSGPGNTESKDGMTITTWQDHEVARPADPLTPAEAQAQEIPPQKPKKPHWVFRIPIIGRVLKWLSNLLTVPASEKA